MFRRTTLRLLIASLLFIALAGGAFANGQGEQQKVTLNYWRHDYQPAVALDKQIIAEYQKQHPNVTVEVLTVSGSDTLHEKLMVAFASKNGPDFFNMEESEFPQYMSSHLVAPVDMAVFGASSYDDLKKKVPALVSAGLQAFEWEGVPYGITTQMSQYAMAINTQHFKDAGLDPDKDYPKTWEDLAVIGQKLVKVENGDMVREAFAIPTHPNCFALVFEGMLRQLGVDVVSGDGKTSNLSSPAAAKVLQTLSDYMYKYKISTLSPEMNRQGRGFETGASSIIVDVGPWYKSWLDQNAPAYGKVVAFKPFPRFKDGKNTAAPSYGYGLMVSTDSKQQKVAWDIIKNLAADAKGRQAIGDFIPDEYPWPQEIGTGGFRFTPKSVVDIVWEATSKTLFDKADAATSLAAANTKMGQYLSELTYKVKGFYK